MKYRFYVWVAALLLMTGLFTSTSMAAEVSFMDTSGHWAEEAIASVVEKELFNGTSETTFSPDISMDRGMFVTVLGRFAEKMGEEVEGTSVFNDVSADAYYAPYVAWAADQGIVKGTSESSFSPTNPVTREQMCTLFIRLLDYAKYDIPAGTDLTFTDTGKISEYAKNAVQQAVALGLIKGVETESGMEFLPADSATRAQVATVFLRLDALDGIYEVMKPGQDPDPVTPNKPDPVDPTPSNPGTPSNPQTPSNPSTPVTPVDPNPVTPDPVDETPDVEPTAEEKAQEEEIAGYMATMLENYSRLGSVQQADKEVIDCLTIITESMSDALAHRSRGAFLSREYVEKNYSENIEKATGLYKSMNDSQKAQIQNIVLQMEYLSHLQKVLDYFGFKISFK